MAVAIATSVASGLLLAIMTGLAGYTARQVHGLRGQYAALVTSQRNQLKDSIVRSYEEARARGFFTALELETLNRRADSYYELGGNNYVRALMEHANSMPIQGEIPD